MKKIKDLFNHRIFKIFKWFVLILLSLFLILIIIRTFHYFNTQKINNQVLKIHLTKLSMGDVMGDNLPKDPMFEADKTIEGIDLNSNGIRDDVEIAIFEEYPNSAKTRAVLLQYALSLQMIFTQPFINEEIATSITQEKSRAYICIGDILIRDDEKPEIMNKYFEDGDNLRSFVEDSQLNNKDRMNIYDNFYKKVRSYSDLKPGCDIDLSKLPN